MESYSFDLDAVHNSNTAADRRPITLFGRLFRFAASLLPGFIKGPIVRRLQARGTNVYKLPVLSSSAPQKREISDAQRALLAEQVNVDLSLLEESTGFTVEQWKIQS